nr:hypothetical protein [Tanacetum cinerariifolium]
MVFFDIDSLTKSMNYEPVSTGNQSNGDAGIQTDFHTGQASQEKAAIHEYILLPFIYSNPPLFSTIQSLNVNAGDQPGDVNAGDIQGDVDEISRNDDVCQGNEIRIDSNTHPVNAASTKATGIFDGAFDDRDLGVEADTNNLDSSIVVSPIPTTRVHKDHPKEQIIGDHNLNTQTKRMINFYEETAMTVVANSTTEAEYVVASSCCRQKKQKPKRKQRKEAEVSNDELEDEDHVPTPSSDPLPSEKNGLGAQENASKQERMIEDIDQNAEIALDDETQRRTNDDEMFGVDDLVGEELVMETTTSVKDSVAPTIDVTEDEVTMAALKSIVFHKQKQSQIPTVSSSKDKGKAKMIKPEVSIKRKEQMRMDEQYARKLEAEKQEVARLSRAQQNEEANNSWDNMQAMMDADRLLAEKLQAREREEFFEVQKERLAQQNEEANNSWDNMQAMMDTDRLLAEKLQAREREEFFELRKCIELVHDDGDEVLIVATPIYSRSPTIIDYKIHKEGKKTYFKIIRADGNSQVYQTFEKMFKNFNREDLKVRLLAKRLQAREKEEFSEVQKARLLVELIEKRKKYFNALRAQEKRNKPPNKTQIKSQMSTYLKHMGGYKYSHLKGMSFDEIKELFDIEIIKNFNKEDLEVLWAIVKDIFKKEKPVDDIDNLLFKTLKTMFEHHVEDTIWKYQQGLAKVKNWKLFESCGVDHDVEMAYDLLRFIRKQLIEGYTPQ